MAFSPNGWTTVAKQPILLANYNFYISWSFTIYRKFRLFKYSNLNPSESLLSSYLVRGFTSVFFRAIFFWLWILFGTFFLWIDLFSFFLLRFCRNSWFGRRNGTLEMYLIDMDWRESEIGQDQWLKEFFWLADQWKSLCDWWIEVSFKGWSFEISLDD